MAGARSLRRAKDLSISQDVCVLELIEGCDCCKFKNAFLKRKGSSKCLKILVVSKNLFKLTKKSHILCVLLLREVSQFFKILLAQSPHNEHIHSFPIFLVDGMSTVRIPTATVWISKIKIINDTEAKFTALSFYAKDAEKKKRKVLIFTLIYILLETTEHKFSYCKW